MKTQRSLGKSIALGLVILLVLVIYAYGFSVTKVNFEETRSEVRLTQLTRILRALAHPDLVEFEQEELDVDAEFFLPCPEGGAPAAEVDTSGPFLTVDPPCGEAGDEIQVEGFNLLPNTGGPLNFIPPSGVKLTLGRLETDDDGHFSLTVKLPNRQPVEEAQILRATARQSVGRPHFTGIAKTTWDKIIETVFLALLATTIGTALAIPISFIAARNLMSSVRVPLTNAALTILGGLVGFGLSVPISGWINKLGDSLYEMDNALINWGGVILPLLVCWVLLRWALSQDERNSLMQRSGRVGALIVAGASSVLFLRLLGNLAIVAGGTLSGLTSSLEFVGYFVSQLGESLRMLTPVVIALAIGGILSSLGGTIGERVANRMAAGAARAVNMAVAAVSGAVLLAALGAVIDWFYQIEDPILVLWGPAGAGALGGLILALRFSPKDPLALGLVFYTITRTILNAIRSIEPLVMVIVFVVWVGIGPFAGALALALHTIAALAKLYSEQVESIASGPLEAIQATGANRLQTIIYAVVPQIIPPYISFTMYRWDINVRMSTIIGFAGGGGIGFLLQQNINLLDYRAASVQMLAIAVVVASMDYVSSEVRNRFV